MSSRKRVGVLISGRGSNLAALIEACKASNYPAEIVCVVSNKAGADGLDLARSAGIDAHVVEHKAYPSRSAFEDALDAVLRQANIDLIASAGFMRILGKTFVERWRNKQLNIHPSLLPAFRGLGTHERALEAGVMIAGATVHFVRTEMDSGPIIAQAAVSVLPGDTPESLAARILEAEHQLYPHALALVASGKVRVEGERVIAEAQANSGQTFIWPPIRPDDD